MFWLRHIEEVQLYLKAWFPSENSYATLPLEERFRIALAETQYMVDENKPAAYNFFMLVFGCIQQAIDVVVSCVEYGCIPYIRYPVSLHYISMLSESMLNIFILILPSKMLNGLHRAEDRQV